MKKIVALLFLGSFVLVLGLGARFYAYPKLAVIPTDLDSTVVAENPPGEPATYFSIADLAEVSGELGNQTHAQVDTAASADMTAELDRDVLVVRTYACTDDIAIDCSTIRYPLSGALSTFLIDRRSGEPVAWDEATLETGGSTDSVEFEGLTIKFPFNAQRTTYQFWNADLRTSIPVEFTGETSVDGLAAYEYRSTVEPTVLGQIDVPGSIIGMDDEPTVTVDRVSSSETTYVVEPESGVIISATSVQDSYAELDGEKVLTITDGTFTTPQSAADETVATYRPLSKALYAVRVLAPVVGSIVGVLLLALAALLAVRRRRSVPVATATTRTSSEELAHVR
jgi:hypothetical protein